MVRILQMIGSLNVGGSQTMILNLYRNIDREKIQFDFVLDHPDERYFAADAEALGARIYNLPGFTGFNAHEVKTAWDSFLTEHPEYKVLHSHVRSYASLYLPIARKHGLKTIIHMILNNENYNAIWRKCVKASCFDGRDHSRYYHIKRGEDLLQSLEILENAGSFLFIPETLYCYRVNPASITHSDSYEGYRANFEVRETVLEFLGKSGVFTEEDYDRLCNNDMDRVAVELKRICRYAPTREAKREAIASIRDSAYYKHFLEPGYRPASPLPGDERPDGLRAFTNRLTAKLLAARRYDAIITLNGLMYKAAKALGAR